LDSQNLLHLSPLIGFYNVRPLADIANLCSV
jgi:hypothetical protein